MEQAFAEADADGSGFIDQAEVRKLLAKEGLASGDEATMAAKLKEFSDTYDKDHDGKVSRQEWLTFYGNFFDQVVERERAIKAGGNA